ncbi:MAG: hypothetical protein EP330_13490 [Deltaproteobacteria bacterium]|nr:MAG: hypothetical protein EP330_13490 [Deltaproteobacteria bacterium]
MKRLLFGLAAAGALWTLPALADGRCPEDTVEECYTTTVWKSKPVFYCERGGTCHFHYVSVPVEIEVCECIELPGESLPVYL